MSALASSAAGETDGPASFLLSVVCELCYRDFLLADSSLAVPFCVSSCGHIFCNEHRRARVVVSHGRRCSPAKLTLSAVRFRLVPQVMPTSAPSAVAKVSLSSRLLLRSVWPSSKLRCSRWHLADSP
jgi:hypothetical protein